MPDRATANRVALAMHVLTADPSLPFTPAGDPTGRFLAGHLSLTWNVLGPRHHTGSLADSRMMPLWRDRDRPRNLHRRHCSRVHRQLSQEFEDFSDGRAQLLALLPAGPDCSLYLLAETIEIPPKLGDLLVVLVTHRLSLPELLFEFAEPRLDPSQRQTRRPVG